MRKKSILKKTACIAMSIILLAGMMPFSFVPKTVEADDKVVNYSPRKAMVNILPASAANNQSFMRDYVIAQKKGGYILNSNSKFKVTGYKNIRSDTKITNGKSLSKDDLLMHQKNDDWWAEYKWNIDGEVFKNLVKNGQITLNYQTSLTPDYHKNISNHWDGKWDNAIMEIKAGGVKDWQIKETSESKSDGQAQDFYGSKLLPEGSSITSLTFKAYHDNCNCGSSKVGGTVIYFTDLDAPYITAIYASSDVNGDDILGASEGFKAGETGYMVLEFSEYIRFFNNTPEPIKLNLDLIDANTDQEIDLGKKDGRKNYFQAELASLKDNKLIFEFNVPEKINDKAINVYIPSIAGEQDWAGRESEAFSGCLISEQGNTFIPENLELKGGSKISDLAGNPVNWSDSNKKANTYIYLDNVNPELYKIGLTGSMIKKDSTLSKNQWTTETDRSAVFAGCGDTLNFFMYFTEELKNMGDISEISAKLNIEDSEGKQVILKASKIESVSAKSVIGVDSASRKITKITFEKLTFTECMKPINDDRDSNGNAAPVRIMAVDGMENAADSMDNKLLTDLKNITMYPNQQEYIDTLSPVITTDMQEASEEGRYIPAADSKSSYMFTVPFTVEDDMSADGGKGEYASGANGMTGSIAMVTETSDNAFWYYVDNNPEILYDANDDSKWKCGFTYTLEEARKYKHFRFPQIEGEKLYLHIRLVHSYDYDYNGIPLFKGSIMFTVNDYAGNQKEYICPLYHNVDRVTPVTSFRGSTAEVNYEKNSADITVTAKVKDNFGIKELQYYWDDDLENTVTVDLGDTAAISKEFEFTASCNFSVDGSDSSRYGTKKLTVTGKDLADNPFVWNREVSFDFRIPKPVYLVEETSADSPMTYPIVDILIPKSINEYNAGTVMLMEAGENTYYAFASDTDARDIFSGIPKTENDSASEYKFKGNWYELTGNVNKTQGTGTFTSHRKLSDGEIYRIGEMINRYGTVDFTFVTSVELTFEKLENNHFSFTNLMTVINEEKVYLANTAEYSVEFTDVVSEEGESVKDRVNYTDGFGMRPVSTLDGTTVHFTVTNLSDDGAEVKYGLNIIDFENSYYEITGPDGKSRTGNLYETDKQTVTIPKGFTDAYKEGWYTFKVVIKTKDGKTYESDTERYFVYPYTEYLCPNPAWYYKKIGRVTSDNTAGAYIRVREDKFNDGSFINIGLAENPEGWTTSPEENGNAVHELVFNRMDTPGINDIVKSDNIQIKVWSDNDFDGENNAPWTDMSDVTEIKYTPVLTEEYSEESYALQNGRNVLPLTEGYNSVNIWMINTNGIITKMNVVMNVAAAPVEFQLEINQTPKLAQVVPKVSMSDLLLKPVFGSLDDCRTVEDSALGINRCEVTSSGIFEFYMYDANGNMAVKQYEFTDLDGRGPGWVDTSGSVQYADTGTSPENFRFSFYARDNGAMSPEDAFITFDADYSALLMGLEGEERAANTEQITVKIPVNMEGDRVWQKITPENYGIYRTEVLEYTVNENGATEYTVDIWGTLKHDETKEEDESVERTFTLTAYDKNGNSKSTDRTRTYSNRKLSLQMGTIHPDTDHVSDGVLLDKNGSLGVFSWIPFKNMTSYGAGAAMFDKNDYYYAAFYTSLPMIYSDGIYEVEYMDLFGNTYRQKLNVNAFSNDDIRFDISDTEVTNKDVIVSATALNPGNSIVSIEGMAGGTAVQGVINALDNTSASIVMPQNGIVTVNTEAGKSHTFKVANIDKEIEQVETVFQYNGTNAPTFVQGSEDTVTGTVTAVVLCGEVLDGTNGPLTYTFPKGSKKGTEYTFMYRDMAGNKGSVTVTLPYNIEEEQEVPPEIDVTAPVYYLDLYGMRNNDYSFLSNHYTPSDGAEIVSVIDGYTAQKYSMMFDIDDDSETKLIIKNSGSAAPASYSEVSDDIEGVSTSGSIIEVEKNTEFDVYIVDSADNVTSLTGIKVNNIDNTPPAVDVEYEQRTDEDGTLIVRAVFISENNETVIPYDTNISAMPADSGDGTVFMRYYQDITENESFIFYYRDIYGNRGAARVNVANIDNSAPEINALLWFGTEKNKKPEESISVNRDVTAELAVSKAVSKISLYKYDPSNNNNGLGEPVNEEEAGIYTEFTGKKARITYTKNVEYEIVAVIQGSGNKKTAAYKLQAVTCIDKTAPYVTLTEQKLSDDKRYKTYKFVTDEDTQNDECTAAGQQGSYRREHTWTVYKNGTYYLVFVDKAGNSSGITVEVSDVDDVKLSLSYSRNSDGSSAVDDGLKLGVKAGETIYIKANKAARITWNGTETDVAAQAWTPFVLSGESGFYAVKAVDLSTGKTVYGNVAAKIKDGVPPVITFEPDVIYMKESTSLKELEQAVRSGVKITDNTEGEITSYELEGVPNQVRSGIYRLTYTARDSSGNETTQNRTLYIYSGKKFEVKVNGSAVEPLGTKIVKGTNVKFEIEMEENEPVIVKLSEGIKTAAQMKYGVTLSGGLKSLPVTKPGFYTVYVRTQSRSEFIFHLYVEK